jgi:hypothetical protein
MFKAVSKGWNCASLGEARPHPFEPWILKSEDVGESEDACRGCSSF